MILDIIKRRRAVFPAQYNENPITKNQILHVLEAANWAPTHKRTEPWRFKVIQGESLIKLGNFLAEKYKTTSGKFSEFQYKKLKENPSKASCIIAICMQRDPNESLPEWEEIAATAMAVQNMWLMCTDLNIGAYWSSPGLIKYMHDFFEFNEGEKCLGFFYMGKFDEQLFEGTRQPIEDK
ncbi:nitroreductase, partial [uncultured Planktosalinus sp.]|uniref:nitroreductase family protein n=1 Tax=uncultured Planktosalinus sp. TaxID=1810935 RepID=UPI0030DD3B28